LIDIKLIQPIIIPPNRNDGVQFTQLSKKAHNKSALLKVKKNKKLD